MTCARCCREDVAVYPVDGAALHLCFDCGVRCRVPLRLPAALVSEFDAAIEASVIATVADFVDAVTPGKCSDDLKNETTATESEKKPTLAELKARLATLRSRTR